MGFLHSVQFGGFKKAKNLYETSASHFTYRISVDKGGYGVSASKTWATVHGVQVFMHLFYKGICSQQVVVNIFRKHTRIAKGEVGETQVYCMEFFFKSPSKSCRLHKEFVSPFQKLGVHFMHAA